MPHQCVRCGEIYPSANEALLNGCSCGSHFFFYIRDDQLGKLKQVVETIPEDEKKQMEDDVREIVGAINEETPVILDLESVRVVGEGRFEIDLVKLFSEKRPVIYKLEEGKYIIDLATTFKKFNDSSSSE